jgi:hypothetical protein
MVALSRGTSALFAHAPTTPATRTMAGDVNLLGTFIDATRRALTRTNQTPTSMSIVNATAALVPLTPPG